MKKLLLFLFLPLYVQAGAVETIGTFNRAEVTICPDMSEQALPSGSFMLPQIKAPASADDIIVNYTFDDVSYMNCGADVIKSINWSLLENVIIQKLGVQGYNISNLLDEYEFERDEHILQYNCTTQGGNTVFYENTSPQGTVDCVWGTNNHKPVSLSWTFSDGSDIDLIYQLAAPENGLSTHDFTTYLQLTSFTSMPTIYVGLTIPAGSLHFATGYLDFSKVFSYWYKLNSKSYCSSSDDAREVHLNVPTPGLSNQTYTVGTFSYRDDGLLESTEFVKDLHDFFRACSIGFKLDDAEHFPSFANLSPHFEFTLPSQETGNAINTNAYNGSWTVYGASGNRYTLSLSNDRKKIVFGNTPIVELDNLGAIRFVEGPVADDILNYCGSDKFGEGETFTAYMKIVVDETCYPVSGGEDWFNVRFLRPLTLYGGNEILMPGNGANDYNVSLSSLFTVKDWRGFTGDPNNQVTNNYGGAFNFSYYQIGMSMDISSIFTDAHLGKKQRNANSSAFLSSNGGMSNVICDYWGDIDDYQFQFEIVPNNVLRFTTYVDCAGEWHLFVPVYMSYVFGSNCQAAYTMLTFKNDEPTNIEVGESNRSMFVNCNNGTVVVDGLADGGQIDVYTTTGVHVGSCKATGGKAHVKAPLPTGTMIIVKAGNKTWKTTMR